MTKFQKSDTQMEYIKSVGHQQCCDRLNVKIIQFGSTQFQRVELRSVGPVCIECRGPMTAKLNGLLTRFQLDAKATLRAQVAPFFNAKGFLVWIMWARSGALNLPETLVL